MVLISKNWKEGEQQIEQLEKQAAKMVLKITFELKKNLINDRGCPNFLSINNNE